MDELMTKETMSSLQIAEISGKQHKHVMESIRSQEKAWIKINGTKFRLVDYTDKKGEKRPMYLLNKTECLYIATKFNDEARAKLVLRWKELEESNKPQLPATYLDALKSLVASEEQKQQLALENKRQAEEIEAKTTEITELNTAISEMQPKVSYVDTILQCKDTVQVTVIAQDYGKSAKAFNILLRNFGIQRKVGTTWVLYGKYIANGYVQSKTFTYTRSDGTQGARSYTEWTQRGRLFLYEMLKNKGILPMIEQ